MRSLPELVEFIRVSCKSQNSSITKMEKDLKFDKRNGRKMG